MNKRFRVCDLEQSFLLPPSLQHWLPEDQLARFVADVANTLDLRAVYAEYERSDGRGLLAYHPLLLTRLLRFGNRTRWLPGGGGQVDHNNNPIPRVSISPGARNAAVQVGILATVGAILVQAMRALGEAAAAF